MSGSYVMRNGIFLSTSSAQQYDGSKSGDELKAWYSQLPDPTDFINTTHDILSSRNATLFNTAAYARAAIVKPLQYIVGEGIGFISMPNFKLLERLGVNVDQKNMVEWSQKFTELLICDKLDLNHFEKQYLLGADSSIIGDSLLWFERDEDGFITDLIPAGGYTIDSQRNDPSKNLKLGIQTDSRQRREGLYVENDKELYPFVLDGGWQNVIQCFLKRERISQVRGYGAVQSVIALLKNMDSVWDATIQRMVLESVILGFAQATDTNVKQQMNSLIKGVGGAKQEDAADAVRSSGVQQVAKHLDPGAVLGLKNDENFQYTKLETPSSNFGNANEWAIRNVAMARGYAPEFIMGLYPTSYSAGQGAINDSMQAVKVERTRFVQTVENKVNLELLKDYVRMGELDVVDEFWEDTRRGAWVRRAYINGKFLGPVPGFRNPLAEAKAEKLLEEDGVINKSDRMYRYGTYNYTSHMEIWAEEQQKFEDAKPEEKEERVIAEENS
jgi:capsid protein